MCGLVGFFYHDNDTPPETEKLGAMLQTILNRGPDAQRVWAAPGVGLGFNRLSIFDLSEAAHQPMVDTETGCAIVFNGAIYNYVELREMLKIHGHRFHTTSDTEVLLKAYVQWGVDCLQQLNGMWAFAIYDPRDKTLFCARDHFGIKPFVYAIGGRSLVFASEAKAITTVFPEWRTPNEPHLAHFIETGEFAGGKASFYKGIHHLMPGHYFVVAPGEIPRQQRYWQWQPSIDNGASEADILAEFDWRLTQSIARRLRSDVPVGLCLSGGLDSNALLALIHETRHTAIPTFSCVYPDNPRDDESRYIQASIDHFKPAAYMTTFTQPDVMTLIERSLWEMDGPTGTPSIISQRAVMELAAEHVTVVLSGQGADETLGGYHAYYRCSLLTILRQTLPHPTQYGNFYRQAKQIEKITGQKFTKSRELLGLLQQALRSTQFESAPVGDSVLKNLSPIAQDDLTTRLVEDSFYAVLPRLLHYEDRTSMAFSLESRVPYLDHELVEFLFSLPHWFKIRGAETKYLLRQRVKNIVPPVILNRTDKTGFNTPVKQWFSNPEYQEQFSRYIERPPIAIASSKHAFLKKYWTRCTHQTEIPMRAELNLWRYFSACVWLDCLMDSNRLTSYKPGVKSMETVLCGVH